MHFLDAQRGSIAAILEGLDDTALNAPVVASGWTPLGLVAHLCGADSLWLHQIVGGRTEMAPPWPTDRPYSPFIVDWTTDGVLAHYRAVAAVSNRNVVAADLDDPPRQAPPPELAQFGPDIRSVVLHMIEETARHAGHLDLAREHIDGRTGLGPR